MSDTNIRKKVKESGLYKTYLAKRRDAFINPFFDVETGEQVKDKRNSLYNEVTTYYPSGSVQTIKYLNGEYFGMTDEEAKECEKIRRATKRQRTDIEKHISYLFQRKDYDLYFVTLTFNDEALTYKEKTRYDHVIRTLSQFDDYIANIDYGDENEREHYHAVVALSKHYRNVSELDKIKNFYNIGLLNKYRYGFYSAEKIKKTDDAKKALAKYQTKLMFHSVKVEQTRIKTKKISDYHEYLKDQARRKHYEQSTNRKNKATYKVLDNAFEKYLTAPQHTKFRKELKDQAIKAQKIALFDIHDTSNFIHILCPLSSRGTSQIRRE